VRQGVKKGQTVCKSCDYDFKKCAPPVVAGGANFNPQTGERLT
jgi:hypothetical protein